MSGIVSGLVRPNVRGMKPYDSPRHHYIHEKRLGEPLAEKILLDANESPRSVLEKPEMRWEHLNRYADPLASGVREGLVKWIGGKCSADNIFVGNGSDEIIELLVEAFAGPGDSVIVMPPTYQMYEVCAEINGAEVRKVPLDKDFQPDVKGVLEAADSSTKIVFICSPNSPTGNLIDRGMIGKLASKMNALVVVDEAYAEFSGESVIGLTEKLDNVVVLRTFSKAWGLAGIRVGYAIASKEAIEYLWRVKLPYNVSAVAQDIAMQALENSGRLADIVEEVIREREWLTAELKNIGLTVFPSDANFLFVQFPQNVSSQEVYDGLIKAGIVVRDQSSKVPHSLRITVGTHEENLRLVEELKAAMS